MSTIVRWNQDYTDFNSPADMFKESEMDRLLFYFKSHRTVFIHISFEVIALIQLPLLVVKPKAAAVCVSSNN